MMNYTTNKSMPVKLKGVGDSLRITIDPTQSLELLKKDIEKIFKNLGHLAINAKIVIDPGENGTHKELISTLGKYLKNTFDVGSVSGLSPKRSPPEERIRQYDINHSWEHYRSDVLMLTGRIRSGQKVSTKRHLVIMGDVNPGAEIIAGGDILIMGSLRGAAFAGQPDKEDAIVFALDFRPSLIQIGGFVGTGAGPSKLKIAEFAHVEKDRIVVKDYLKTNPFGKMPWPDKR